MKKRMILTLGAVLLSGSLLAGCGNSSASETAAETDAEAAADNEEETTEEERGDAPIEDGVYSAEFDTDSDMFHLNEMMDGRGTLTVENGYMTIHITLVSKNIVNVYPGTAAEAQEDGAVWIEPTVDEVDYQDGTDPEEVYGFDVPVPALDEEFDLAIIGTHGNWYDHKVIVSDPVAVDASATDDTENQNADTDDADADTDAADNNDTDADETESKDVVSADALADGTYEPDGFAWSGGTGKVELSCSEVIIEDGQANATISFSSTYYTEASSAGETYETTIGEDSAEVTLPVELNQNYEITGTTTRMSQPHEITYTIYVALGDSEDGYSDLSECDTLDEEAPVIMGLETVGEVETEGASYLKLFEYEDGVLLLETDLATDTDRKETETDTDNLYLGNVVKYLLVPANVEIPAGLDQYLVIVQLPTESAWVASENALEIITKDLDAGDSVASEAVDEDVNFKSLVADGNDLIILPSSVLESEDYADYTEKFATLGIPMLVDRSGDEENDSAGEAWGKVYGVLFDKE